MVSTIRSEIQAAIAASDKTIEPSPSLLVATPQEATESLRHSVHPILPKVKIQEDCGSSHSHALSLSVSHSRTPGLPPSLSLALLCLRDTHDPSLSGLLVQNQTR
ncbi:hypothetical protein M5K25_012900 [Dendrobium thyrsiflorum]|uniref:Uncharacterized protein n=1 Tax=Dendrobium thyrsiflorum TaxID=117978 RepID=A0ABD0UYK8_DENTH